MSTEFAENLAWAIVILAIFLTIYAVIKKRPMPMLAAASLTFLIGLAKIMTIGPYIIFIAMVQFVQAFDYQKHFERKTKFVLIAAGMIIAISLMLLVGNPLGTKHTKAEIYEHMR